MCIIDFSGSFICSGGGGGLGLGWGVVHLSTGKRLSLRLLPLLPHNLRESPTKEKNTVVFPLSFLSLHSVAPSVQTWQRGENEAAFRCLSQNLPLPPLPPTLQGGFTLTSGAFHLPACESIYCSRPSLGTDTKKEKKKKQPRPADTKALSHISKLGVNHHIISIKTTVNQRGHIFRVCRFCC